MLTAILIVLVFVVFLFQLILPKKLLNFPPGPPERFFVGNAPEFRRLAKKLGGQHFAFMELAKIYQTEVIGLKLGRERVICACSFDTIRKVFLSNEYLARPDNFFIKLRSMGTKKGITSTDGPLWKEQRAFVVTHLRSLGFGKSLMEEMVKDEIRDTIYLIETHKELVFSSVLPTSVLNVLWKITSGQSLKGNTKLVKLMKLMKERNLAFDMSGGTLNDYPWLRFFAAEKTGYNLLKTLNNELKELIMETIDEHKTNWFMNRDDDLIYAFLNEMDKRRGTFSNFTDDQLVMICLDIFIAGSTSTSASLDFAFLAMVLYPEIQEKVYATISKEFLANEEISYSSKQRIPYVEAVLLECQRFFTVLPVAGPRRTLEKVSLNNYLIPKDTTVLLNLYSVYQDKSFWKDPEIFKPERFLDINGNLIHQDRILTFGLGKRKCLGDALAKSCIFLFFIEILRKYRIEKSDNQILTGKQRPGLLLSPEKYKCKFKSRI